MLPKQLTGPDTKTLRATRVNPATGSRVERVRLRSVAMTERDIDECASSPCENDATCADAVNLYTCHCVVGYMGTRCETDIDECASSPCENDATCADAVNLYTCHCVVGYMGTRCETDIDECASSPCENGATCADAVNLYTCHCVVGYMGTRCETDIDECASSPCENGATCADAVNLYTCHCVVGYMGTRCETDIDECASSPCENGATCADAVNSYTCLCVAGYTGTHCETAITCEPLTNVRFGRYSNATCSARKMFYNDTCELMCDFGYVLEGPQIQICTLEWEWTPTITGLCERIHCPALTLPHHALVVSDPRSTIAGSVVTYGCREGYELNNGSLVLECNLDGRWSDDPPQCTEIRCPSPDQPAFTEVDVTALSYVYKTIVTYSCQTGFDLIAGDTERTCLANRRWSGVKPLCRIVSCGSLASVAHALYEVPEETTYMTNITYDCEEGYKRGVGGDWTRTCLENKQWSGTPPVCLEIVCTNPPEVRNTLLDVGGTRMNEYAHYACVLGFRLEGGSETKRCNKESKWEGKDPLCVEIVCGEPRQVDHTQMIATGRKLKAKVVYSCKTGYEQVSGNNTAVCKESGHWSDVTLVCRAVTCGAPPQPVHTLVVESGEGISGTADYDCEKGYQLTSGTTRSSCTAQGLWTDVTIKCQPITCPVTDTTAHVVIVNQTGVQLDDIVTLACEPGYHHVSGSTIRTCLWTRDWSGAPITCEEMMCNEPMPVLGARVSYPSLSVHASATYRCSEGYRAAAGDFSHTCQVNGTWSGQRPTCEGQ
ncbi:hypothetical protein NP493_923g00015 [Ridgeia piscesae]|uniref:Sushi, von Willebrand factor type A, EGF and pentraxin domain-containing protein 1-like n=1 Tax=Ridgeia piscesae TaxID=27915 RepID=A0AAD9KJP8_RIDPI|nr:hypothetical protein NP493_923g00015 [Ridgeia piscesae]